MIKEQIFIWLESVIPWMLSHGIRVVVIVVGAWVLSFVFKKAIARIVQMVMVSGHHTSKQAEEKRRDTLLRIFSGLFRITLLIIVVLMILSELGLKIGPILAGAGIVGLAVGFGGQYLIRDLISGLFIIMENQYRVGDVVKFNDTAGLVEDISMRMTTLRDLDGTVHHIPHGEIKVAFDREGIEIPFPQVVVHQAK